MKNFVFIVLLFSFLACKNDTQKNNENTQANLQAYSLFNEPLYSAEPSEALIERSKKHLENYKRDSLNVNNIIWHGRFTAYQGDYKKAISIFSEGIKHFPEDPRLYRHRGHRYITIRKFDLAVKDLEHAAKLIKNTPNQIEPDGMPNAMNIPVSTLHGNIWYHLGLAYYLNNNLSLAYEAFKNCLQTSSNADNVVSSSHWLYMILRRLNKNKEAAQVLTKITDSMSVIENHAYHKLCLFYKEAISEDSLFTDSGAPSNDAIAYGIANWYFYNGEVKKSKKLLEKLLNKKSWNSFGYIAAESHYYHNFAK